MEQLTLRELMQATNGRLRDVDSAELTFQRIVIDSRNVQRGDVFWALHGDRHDGHTFAPQALQKGAILGVVTAAKADSIAGPVLIVDETTSSLGHFANWYRSQCDSLVIGVTGSVGKTTTRELVYSALSSQFQGVRSLSNFNNEIGLPLSLLEMEFRHEFAVIEMGASERGNIRELCELAHPEIGIVTAIGLAHLQSFGSIDAIIETKGELLEFLPSTGFAILPGDDVVLRRMALRAPCPVLFVGQEADNRIRATRIEAQPNSLRFHCEGTDFRIPVTGRHVLTNALCAIALGLEIGIKPNRLAEGLANFQSMPGRCEVVQISSWTIINDSYNASPLAVAAACQLLREMDVCKNGQRILILGDMRELGDMASIEHERVGSLVAKAGIDRLLVCGDHAADVARGAAQFGMKSHHIVAANDFDTLTAMLDCWLQPNDVLLIKGSRSTRMERVLEWLKERAEHDERQNRNLLRRQCA